MLLLALSTACGEREQEAPRSLRLDRVEVVTTPLHAVQRQVVEDAVRTALASPGGLEPAGEGANLRGAARVEELHGEAGQPILRLTLVAGAGDEHYDAVVEIERRDGSLRMTEDLPVVAMRAVAILEAKIALEREGPKAAPELLRAQDPEIALLALEWVDEARAAQVADDVAHLLGHEDSRVALGAVQVLGSIGTDAHVEALLHAGRLAEPDFAHHLYMTLGRIGGARAEAFLDFAATNEDDPALARSAQRALRRVAVDQEWAVVAQPRRGHR